ncbi:Na(+)/H(+) antiporter NhaA [Parapedobacter defluvii]|uniref:Na(+)/H(+) antiporter NhaA n=1 Tax=Parapedobacter defluvii TaxID=2045106 RepID=A0ABQ1MLV1_9SPHI|nr:Na+/H+ antiporter NhaA [Parapedobacter defluvii]GGC42451.1 Na(+)/H(+) antiporter NhaA [Parapedobacter defluvii]
MNPIINLRPFREFLKSGSAGGIILLCCVIVSLVVANSPLGVHFERFLTGEWGIHTEQLHLRYSVLLWINDGLMAIFFLMVGLEIKRELVEGELSSPKKAALPILAAIGGVLVPATIYTLFNSGTPTAAGWGIPMATDIAFALAIITMLGKKVPASLKIFLAALAIVDDLVAILVIAVFYTSELHFTYLLYAVGLFALLLLFNRLGVKRIYLYLIPGLFIWYFVHHSGIHATIAGVLVAMTLPTTPDAKESPLEKLEHLLVKPVNFVIMPIFALANTNIRFQEEMFHGLFTPLGLGIILGLAIGKPVGITVISWLAVKLRLCTMPEKATWSHIIGVGFLAGIGFTMSIFIALLSFTGQELLMAEAKFSVLVASFLSGILGALLLSRIARKHRISSNEPLS